VDTGSREENAIKNERRFPIPSDRKMLWKIYWIL
jgi:hypothetical protein